MKKYILAGISLLLSSCISHKMVVNRVIEHPEKGSVLVGIQKVEQFSTSPYSDWYDREYSEYEVDKETIKQLRKKKLSSYQIIAFVGTWNEDSKRELPRLVKILEAVKYPHSKLVIIGLDPKKESPNGEEGQYAITQVPTIVLKKYGNEVGRIATAPKSGFIEKDLLEIVSRKEKFEKLEREVNPKQP